MKKPPSSLILPGAQAVALKGLAAILNHQRGAAVRLANELDVGESRVSQWKSGHPCPAHHVAQIAEILGVPEIFLLKGVTFTSEGKMQLLDENLLFAHSPQQAEFMRQQIINDFGENALPKVSMKAEASERVEIFTKRWRELFADKIRAEAAKTIADQADEIARLKNETKLDPKKPAGREDDPVSKPKMREAKKKGEAA